MLAISLLLALVIDRMAPLLQSFRKDYPLQTVITWLIKQPLIKSIPARLLPYFLILPILLLVALLDSIVRFSGIFELGFKLLIAFICLQPQVLNEEVDDAIKALESSASVPQQDVDSLFNKANRSLFSVIFWMVIAGPIWVVGYRLLDSLLAINEIPQRDKWCKDIYRLVSWVEWLPALISSYLFMLCGNFESGIKAARDIPLFAVNIRELNETRLGNIGLAVVQAGISDAEVLTSDALRRSRGMLLRSLVVWLLLAGIIDYWL